MTDQFPDNMGKYRENLKYWIACDICTQSKTLSVIGNILKFPTKITGNIELVFCFS